MWTFQKSVAFLFGLVPAIAGLLFVLFIWFLVTFPWENTEPMTGWEKVGVGLMVAAGLAVAGVSLVSVYAIAVDHLTSATRAYLGQLVLVACLLAWGVSASQHSDGTVWGLALGVEMLATLSILLARGD